MTPAWFFIYNIIFEYLADTKDVPTAIDAINGAYHVMDTNQQIPECRLVDLKNVTGKQVFRLTQDQISIGRASTNDFIILKNTISGRHARIQLESGAFHLTDLGSTNKTRVNGTILAPHTPTPLEDGDEIQFDVYKFVYMAEKEKPKAETPDPGGLSEPKDEMLSGLPEKRKIGRYETFSKLGRGGFGSVWKAVGPNGEIVAIKLLNPENLEDDRAVRKFFHEAIILSHLNHQNITRFIDFFPKEKNYVIVMDFVEGTDLKTLLKRQQGPLSFDLACRVASQVLEAFHFAHGKGIIHRDIKPENIILDQENNAKIMDFGIAKMSSAATQKTAFSMISPLYTPPERFDRSSKVDVRSDIYSLGLVFYEIFTGKHPIRETNPSKIIFAHINQLFDPPEQYAELPHSMSQAILKALEKNPEDRFKDFAEFKQAFLTNNGSSTVDKALRSDERKEAAQTDPSPDLERQSLDHPLPETAINVPPDLFQVGVAVLGLFSETLKKLPKTGNSFSIMQLGTALKLVIETADGGRQTFIKDMKKILDAARKGKTLRQR